MNLTVSQNVRQYASETLGQSVSLSVNQVGCQTVRFMKKETQIAVISCPNPVLAMWPANQGWHPLWSPLLRMSKNKRHKRAGARCLTSLKCLSIDERRWKSLVWMNLSWGSSWLVEMTIFLSDLVVGCCGWWTRPILRSPTCKDCPGHWKLKTSTSPSSAPCC